MNLVVVSMMGVCIGLVTSRMMWGEHGRSIPIVNVLAGVCGALLAGLLVAPFLARFVRRDFAAEMSLVLLGAVALVSAVTLVRRAVFNWERR